MAIMSKKIDADLDRFEAHVVACNVVSAVAIDGLLFL